MKREKICILPKIYRTSTGKGWFIYFSYKNPATGKMHRFRKYEGFAACDTTKQCEQNAQLVCKKYTDLLKNGWDPFRDQNDIIYTDQVEYRYISKTYRTKRKSNNTVNYYLSSFIENVSRTLKPKTLESYRSKCRLFERYLRQNKLHDNDISIITPTIIQEFINHLRDEKHLVKRTLEKYVQTLHRLFEYFIKQGLIKNNPVIDIELPRRNEVDQSAKPILANDRSLLLDTIKQNDPWLHLACLFQWYCFIRPGTELRLLKIKQINFLAQTVTIYGYDSKNGESEVIEIPNSLMEIITKTYQLQHYNSEYHVFGRLGMPGPEPLGKNTLRNRFNRFRDALGMTKEYKFYSWKHSGAITAEENGVPLSHLQNQLRHKSLGTTAHYIRRFTGQKSEQIRKNFPEP